MTILQVATNVVCDASNIARMFLQIWFYQEKPNVLKGLQLFDQCLQILSTERTCFKTSRGCYLAFLQCRFEFTRTFLLHMGIFILKCYQLYKSRDQTCKLFLSPDTCL